MMRKKGRSLLLAVTALLAVFVLAACGGGGGQNSAGSETNNQSADEVIQLNFGHWQPSTHNTAYGALEPWKEYVEEKTDGRVIVHLHHGSTLGGAGTALEDIQGGVYDVGMVIATYYYDTALFPYTIGNLAFSFPDPSSAARVLTKFGEKYDIDFGNAILMGVASTDAYDFYSTKPIQSLADMKGMKVRAMGKVDSELIKTYGAVPVTMPVAETYENLQRGVVDMSVHSPISGLRTKLYEVAPYITKINISTTPVLAMMNKDFYNKLPDDLKKMFDEDFSPKLAEMYTESYVKEMGIVYQELEELAASDDKVEFITLSEDALQEFKAMAKEQWDFWVQEANKRGYNGEKMMNEFKTLLQEEGLELPF